ncbi:hypothetical protein D0Z00_001057 [Geotrichum galactomycetum]|uniref:Uncharacterized protein n=1 Tax=Geotrichum galactomycetum TaxID=27317 RepID=A0ACB6V8I6_9ASCO|nr:hypothetical protein D0Z00_001057 [Geotrichum candidum]
MKFSTIISTAAFTASTLAIATPFDKVKLIKRQQPFLNGSIALSNEDSTVYRTVTPTSTITHLKTIVVSIPATTTSAREVVSESVVVSDVVTTKDSGEITTVDVTSTEKLTRTVYDTITTQAVKTITAPAQDVQNVINSAVNNDGVASVDNIIVSKKKKTITVTHPIYITVTASATASDVAPAVITSLAGNDVDTVTLETAVTSTLKASTSAPYQNGTLSAADQLITTTVVLPKSETTVHTYTHQVTSTVTNFIVVTHTAAAPSESASVETVTSVNEFIYNSQEVATETPTSMVTSVITLTRTATRQTITETQKNIIYYTVTRTSANSTVVETRSAVDTETKTRTNTFTITVPVSATSTGGVEATASTDDSAAAAAPSPFSTTLYAKPSFASMSGAWNATTVSATAPAADSFERRNFQKRRLAFWF